MENHLFQIGKSFTNVAIFHGYVSYLWVKTTCSQKWLEEDQLMSIYSSHIFGIFTSLQKFWHVPNWNLKTHLAGKIMRL